MLDTVYSLLGGLYSQLTVNLVDFYHKSTLKVTGSPKIPLLPLSFLELFLLSGVELHLIEFWRLRLIIYALFEKISAILILFSDKLGNTMVTKLSFAKRHVAAANITVHELQGKVLQELEEVYIVLSF
jgi:hypothetical protein